MVGGIEMVRVSYTIRNEEGLHARPASDFCKTASSFKSKISVIKDGEQFEAKSILTVLCIGAVKGDTIEFCAEGPDEEEAIKALTDVLDAG